MRFALAILTAALLAGCGSTGTATPTLPEQRPGNDLVYQRIETSNDCVGLQAEFNQADANARRLQDAGATATVPLSYMDAADKRMRAIGCY